MRKIIYGSASALVLAGLTLTAVLAGAGEGDAVYVLTLTEPAALDGTQKAALAAPVNATWPTVGAANLDGAECRQNLPALGREMWCRAWRRYEVAELTDVEYLQAALDGKLGDPSADAKITKYTEPVRLTSALETSWRAYVEAVYGVDLELMFEFNVQRDHDAPTTVRHSGSEVVTRSPTEFRADHQAGLVRYLVGRVE